MSVETKIRTIADNDQLSDVKIDILTHSKKAIAAANRKTLTHELAMLTLAIEEMAFKNGVTDSDIRKELINVINSRP